MRHARGLGVLVALLAAAPLACGDGGGGPDGSDAADASVPAPDAPVPGIATVELHDSFGVPLGGHPVFSSRADGTLFAEATLAADGATTIAIEPGGFVTLAAYGALFTWVDVDADDVLVRVVSPREPVGGGTITLELPEPFDPLRHAITTSCGFPVASGTTATVQLYPGCARFDALLTEVDPDADTITRWSRLAAPVEAPFPASLTLPAFRAGVRTTSMTYRLGGVPENVSVFLATYDTPYLEHANSRSRASRTPSAIDLDAIPGMAAWSLRLSVLYDDGTSAFWDQGGAGEPPAATGAALPPPGTMRVSGAVVDGRIELTHAGAPVDSDGVVFQLYWQDASDLRFWYVAVPAADGTIRLPALPASSPTPEPPTGTRFGAEATWYEASYLEDADDFRQRHALWENGDRRGDTPAVDAWSSRGASAAFRFE